MHRRCYQEMERQVRTCGNCRRVINDELPEIVLETDEELEEDDDADDPFTLPAGTNSLARMVQELEQYRSENRPMRSHHEGSYMWNEMPYDVDPDIWQDYYVMFENFVTLSPNRIMYVHGCVHLFVEPTREIRGVLYRLFIFNTPYSTYNLIRIQRFRLFFIRLEGRRDVVIQYLCLLPFPGGPSLYHEDSLWTWRCFFLFSSQCLNYEEEFITTSGSLETREDPLRRTTRWRVLGFTWIIPFRSRYGSVTIASWRTLCEPLRDEVPCTFTAPCSCPSISFRTIIYEWKCTECFITTPLIDCTILSPDLGLGCYSCLRQRSGTK